MSHLIPIVSKLSNISQLRQLHAHLIRNSLHRQKTQNYCWVSLLVETCTRLHAPPTYTRLVFDSVPSPNAHVYISMFKYWSQMGDKNEAFSLFRQMQNCCNEKSGAFVYPAVVKSAGKDGILFHAHILKLGHANDCYVRNVMLDVYVKFQPVEVCKKLFDEMPERSVVDWNLMVSAYWKWGDECGAVRLFNLMPERNVVTWTTMVSGYCKLNDLVGARRYFEDMPSKNVVSWNAMLSGYAQNGSAQEGLRLFADMIRAGVRHNETTWVAVISLCCLSSDPCIADSLLKMLDEKRVKLNCFAKTALLDLHAKCGNLKAARKIFDELGQDKNLVSWNTMISAYSRIGHLDLARELFDRMPERDTVSWNSMIAGHVQNGQSAVAIQLFKEMIGTRDSKPDEVTMVSVISACGHLGALEMGNWVVNFVSEYGIKLSVSGYNSLIFMYSKCGNMEDACRIFEEMESRDVVSYNALVSGFASHGEGTKAIKLLSVMKEECIEPDRVTYIGILTACSHAGLLEEGQEIFQSIKSPAVDHYACMVDLLGRVGKLDDAMRLIDSMPMEPQAGVYGSLLNASRLFKSIEIGELAANKLFQLEPQNSGNYVLLSNIYASARRWEDVDRVREMMRRRGVKKATGWSWIEYEGKTHKFIVGDRAHERSNDIYMLLAELGRKMRKLGYAADGSCVLRDVDEEEKEEMVGTHSEKLAVCFVLLVSKAGSVIRVVKNLRVCWDCHTAMKMISKLEKREIILRDNNRFHHFREGLCSCRDHW